MSKKIEQLKSNLYSYIEQLQDEAALQMLQEAATAYSSQNENDNELNSEQQKRLQESIQQANEGKTVSNEEVKQKTKEWLSK